METDKKDSFLMCYCCGHELAWDSSENLSDHNGDENDMEGVVNNYHCTECGREYAIYDPNKEERETIYKNYWFKQ